MAPKPEVENAILKIIVNYLVNPAANTEIHAELPARHRTKFEEEYAAATNNSPLPNDNNQRSYYIWPDEANKYGRELRIYFTPVPPVPQPVQDLFTDHGKWYARKNHYRINHSKLVMQLFECGFVLGMNRDKAERVAEFMRRKFPV